MAIRSSLRKLVNRLTGRKCPPAPAPTTAQEPRSVHGSPQVVSPTPAARPAAAPSPEPETKVEAPAPQALPVAAAVAPPVATPAPTPEPVLTAPAEPAHEPEAAAPAPAAGVEVKKVWIKNPSAVVALANAADEDMLRTWGLRGAGLTAVMARRPFGSVEDLAATEGVGRRTLQHLATVTDDA